MFADYSILLLVKSGKIAGMDTYQVRRGPAATSLSPPRLPLGFDEEDVWQSWLLLSVRNPVPLSLSRSVN